MTSTSVPPLWDEISEIPTTPVKHLYRRDAVDTSVTAAEQVDTSRLEQMVYDAIVAAGSYGATADDLLHRFPGFSYSSITARPAALLKKGLVVRSGRRRPGTSGRSQHVLIASRFVAGAA